MDDDVYKGPSITSLIEANIAAQVESMLRAAIAAYGYVLYETTYKDGRVVVTIIPPEDWQK